MYYENKNAHRTLARAPFGKRRLGRPRSRKDSITIDYKKNSLRESKVLTFWVSLTESYSVGELAKPETCIP